MNEEQVKGIAEQNMSAGEELSSTEEKIQELRKAFDPDKAKVIRNELFANLRDPAVTFRKDNITFNTACIKGLEDAVWVNLMIIEELGLFAVTKCDENDKQAIRWCVAKDGNRKSRRMRCPDLGDLVYPLMNWDKKCRYKVRGYKIPYNGQDYFVFDLNFPKIYNEKPKKGEEELDENGDVIKVDTRTGYYAGDIAETYGVPMEQYKKETEVTEMGNFVNVAMLTGTREAAKAVAESIERKADAAIVNIGAEDTDSTQSDTASPVGMESD